MTSKAKTTTYMKVTPDRRPPADGLYITPTHTTHLFKKSRQRGKRKQLLSIGSSPNCDIRIQGADVERVHAMLERRRGIVYLFDRSKNRDIFIDGAQLVAPEPLLTGMVLHIADVQVIATDSAGHFPIPATTVSDLCRRAYELCGSYREAGRRVGRSHNFIAKQFIPRADRYAKASKTKKV